MATSGPEDGGTGRWITLGVTVLAAFIVVMDTSILNVSIPTIVRELDTTLPALRWVITGYALTFASLMIIGGRLGDVYGHRKVFSVGFALFGLGSLVASLSTSVVVLFVGEAVIEGIGAALLLPASLALLSRTFAGAERAKAFAAWGAAAGLANAFGPVIGGFLTTNYSWRWSFRMNVVIACSAIAGAALFMARDRIEARPMSFDIPGAALVAFGMFLLVFTLGQGGTYGWWSPIHDVIIADRLVWPVHRAVSLVPIAMLAAGLILAAFVRLESHLLRTGGSPLVDIRHLRLPSHRWGLIVALVVAMGQLSLSFVLPVFLQGAKHLTAAESGLWVFPGGLFVIAGAQLGGRLTRRYDAVTMVRGGLVLYSVGVLLIVRAITVDLTAAQLLPGLALYGIGVGLAVAQLTSVILSEIPLHSAGVASGSTASVRQLGSALGVSAVGSLLTLQTAKATLAGIRGSSLSADGKAAALTQARAVGPDLRRLRLLLPQDQLELRRLVEQGAASGARLSLLFAAFVIAAGAALSFAIPKTPRPVVETIPPDPEVVPAGLPFSDH